MAGKRGASGRKNHHRLYQYPGGDFYAHFHARRVNLGPDLETAKENAARAWGCDPSQVNCATPPLTVTKHPDTGIQIVVSRPHTIVSKLIGQIEAKRDVLNESLQELYVERQGVHIEGSTYWCSACGQSVVIRPSRICSRCNPNLGAGQGV